MAVTYNTASIPLPSDISNSVLTSTGSNGTSWAYTQPSPTQFQSTNHKKILTIPHGEEKMVLEKNATLEVQGNVVINGVDLEKRLSTIEKVLQIPTRDVTIEAKHPKLAELYQQYMHELEKYKTWERLKGTDDD